MRIRPSIRLAALPHSLPLAGRLRLAAEAGIEGIEMEVGEAPAAEVAAAASANGLVVHSVHTYRNYSHPLSSADAEVREAGVGYVLEALDVARAVGAETFLLIAGRVEGRTGYRDAHDRSREVIASRILPAAAERGIVLGIENVWNGFLLGPLEYVDYCESFGSPWVRPYLDVGNVVHGRPEDWIEIAGPRIVALHLKDFNLHERGARSLRFDHRSVGDGMVDWAAVRAALERTGFTGWGVFAQAEHLQGPFALGATTWARRAHKLLRPVPLAGAVASAAQALLARRLLGDVMARHRRYLA